MSIRLSRPSRRTSVRPTAAAAALTALALGASLVGLTTAGPSGAAGVATAPVAARHTSYAVATGGRTLLALNPGTAQVLADNGVTVAPAGEAKAVKVGVAFPISGGLLKTSTLAGTVDHTGGLTFTAGGKSLTIRDFTVNTGAKLLTAYADEAGARLPVLRLRLAQAKVTVTKNRLLVAKLPVTLTAKAASALNSYFGTSLFAGGLKVGTVRLDAKIKVLKS